MSDAFLLWDDGSVKDENPKELKSQCTALAPPSARLSLRIPQSAWNIVRLRQLVAPGFKPENWHAEDCRGVVEVLLGAEHWTTVQPDGWELDEPGVEGLRAQGARTLRHLSALEIPHMIAFEDGEGTAPEIDGFSLGGALIEGGACGARCLASDSLVFDAILQESRRLTFIEAQVGFLAWTNPFGLISTFTGLPWEPAAPAWAHCEWQGQDPLGRLAAFGWPDSSPFTRLSQIIDAALGQRPAEIKLACVAFRAWCVAETFQRNEVSWRAAHFAQRTLSQHPELAFELPPRAQAFFDLPLSRSLAPFHEAPFSTVEAQWLWAQSLTTENRVLARRVRSSL